MRQTLSEVSIEPSCTHCLLWGLLVLVLVLALTSHNENSGFSSPWSGHGAQWPESDHYFPPPPECCNKTCWFNCCSLVWWVCMCLSGYGPLTIELQWYENRTIDVFHLHRYLHFAINSTTKNKVLFAKCGMCKTPGFQEIVVFCFEMGASPSRLTCYHLVYQDGRRKTDWTNT